MTTVLSVLIAARAAGDTIRVPADIPTIEAALVAAGAGDEILASPGEHAIAEPLVFDRKPVAVRSEAGPDATVLRLVAGPPRLGRWSVVIFASGAGDDTAVEGFTITGGGSDGGIVCLEGARPRIEGCRIAGNAGSGIACGPGSSPIVVDCEIEANASERGGGLRLEPGAAGTFVRCDIRGNHAAVGGGVYCGSTAAPVLEECEIAGNVAYDGGGIACSPSASPAVHRSRITGNAAAHGGGVYSLAAAPILSRCVILGNWARRRGGGLYGSDPRQGRLFADPAPSLDTCLVAGNAASERGGAVHISGVTPVLLACTIHGNWAESGPSLVFLARSTNCLAWQNVEVLDFGGVPGNLTGSDPLFARPGTFDFGSFRTFSLFGELLEVPDFVIDPGDYTLGAGSPAVDSGVARSAALVDLDGKERPCGAGIDVGAHELGICPPGLDARPEPRPGPAFPMTVEPDPIGLSFYSEIIFARVEDAAGRPEAGARIRFGVEDEAEAHLPVAESYTDAAGGAIGLIRRLSPPDGRRGVLTAYVVSSESMVSGPHFARDLVLVVDGIHDFVAPPLEPFHGPTQVLAGDMGVFPGAWNVGDPVLAWSVDPRVAEVRAGTITGPLEGSFEQRVKVEFPVVAHGLGTTLFVIGTVDLSLYEATVSGSLVLRFRRSDANDDAGTDASDALRTLGHLFLGEAEPGCRSACDSNDDGRLDIADPVHTLQFLFLGGPAPPPPGSTDCGEDPTPDHLDCRRYPSC